MTAGIAHTDVVVVGAGILGATTAYHLTRRGLGVTVVDQFAGPAEGSTGRSFASIRGQWSDPLNIDMSWRSICHFRDFAAEHGVDIGYRPTGYLLLVEDAQWEAHLGAVELQRRHGVPVDILDIDAAQAITPFNPDGIGGATWGPADGIVDPTLSTSAFITLARDAGARIRYSARVTAVERDGDGWLVTAGGATVRAQYLVNAAGGWAGELAELAGLSVPVVHSRRNIYASAPHAIAGSLPMSIDVTTGIYVRSEGPRLLFGGANPAEVDGYRTDVDWPWMESVLARGVPRFPWLADLPLDRSACWAGTYENTPDHHGILGADPSAPSWINACGFSGHGLMQGPEIGRLVAEEIVDGGAHSCDITPLRLDRFTEADQRSSVELVF
jgi:sarcosine oxidase subunit beta